MAKEYKFMFDRRFDEEERNDFSPSVPAGANPAEEQSGNDGIPSISQLLDSINEHIAALSDGENGSALEKTDEDNSSVPPADDLKDEPVPAEQTEEQKNEAAPEIDHPPSPSPLPSVPDTDDVESKCQRAREEGLLSGMEKGKQSGLEEGRRIGMEEGRRIGLEEGRQVGMEEGRQSAWKEAMESIQKQNSDTLISIDASLKKLFESVEQNGQAAFSTALEFALAVCKKALPALNEINALTEIRSLLEKNLHFLKDEQRISLHLNPASAEQIKPALTDLVKKESYHGKIAVVRDESLPVGDCRIEWKNGGLEKNLQDILNHTEELVHLYTHTGPANESPADHTGE